MAQRLSHPEREGQVKGQFRHAPQKQTRSRRSCASTIQALALLLPGHGKCRSWLQASSTLVEAFKLLQTLPTSLLQRKSGKGGNKPERRARTTAQNHPLHGSGEPKDGAASPGQVVLVPEAPAIPSLVLTRAPFSLPPVIISL